MKKGLFITLEGIDGCGKSTHAKKIAETLRSGGEDVLHTREPGGTTFAEDLRKILLNPKKKIDPIAELMLFEAGRAQHIREIVLPALESGKHVICERFTESTVAYQGYGRGLDLTLIDNLNRIATMGVIPNLTILMDVSVETGMSRVGKGEIKGKDRMELEGDSFHHKVRNGYKTIAQANPFRIKIVDSEKPLEETFADALKYVNDALLIAKRQEEKS